MPGILVGSLRLRLHCVLNTVPGLFVSVSLVTGIVLSAQLVPNNGLFWGEINERMNQAEFSGSVIFSPNDSSPF